MSAVNLTNPDLSRYYLEYAYSTLSKTLPDAFYENQFKTIADTKTLINLYTKNNVNFNQFWSDLSQNKIRTTFENSDRSFRIIRSITVLGLLFVVYVLSTKKS